MNSTSPAPMQNYLIQPLAPIIVRSGRPFDDQAGADAARFPPPSTLAGALRTAHADSTGKHFTPELANIPVMGPLPVKLTGNGQVISLLMPKPADALYFWNGDKTASRVMRAAPSAIAPGTGMNLPDGLLPVQLAEAALGKPASGPRWWSYQSLAAFRDGQSPEMENIKIQGWIPPEDDRRTHVSIERATHASAAGKLFQTSGLSFSPRPTEKTTFGQDAWPTQRIELLAAFGGPIEPGVITLGGERRLSAIAAATQTLWPSLPNGMAADIASRGGVCLTLLTPALFGAGWRPAWLDEKLEGSPPDSPGIKLRLRAAALERWQPHSGWDLAQQKARAGRKLAPAGGVYWFEVLQGSADDLKNLWLSTISDHIQDRRDGFGLVLVHAWTPVNSH